MFYLQNVEEWLEEILDTCRKNRLDPSKSIFCLILFSSLDDSYVKFFRKKKDQIFSYSGKNVHLFTPIIYKNDVVPDEEWRILRQTFVNSGIHINYGPSAVLFRLKKRDLHTGFDPEYIGAFALPEQKRISPLMRDFVSICIHNQATTKSLLSNLSEMLGGPNLIHRDFDSSEINLTPRENPLHAPAVFLSYSHEDGEIVSRVYEELKRHGLRVWFDKFEIHVGANVINDVKRGLDASDAALLFLSASSANSSWLPFEGAFFHGAGPGRAIIPIVLDEEGKELARRLPLTKDRLYIDMSGSGKQSESFKALADQVRRAVHTS